MFCSEVSESFLSSQSHKPLESESTKVFSESEPESWLVRVELESCRKNWRVTSNHWLANWCQCRVTRNFTFFL